MPLCGMSKYVNKKEHVHVCTIISCLHQCLVCATTIGSATRIIFSSAVPSGSGAFQMPTRPSSSASASSSAASTLRGGRANLRNAS